MINLPDFDKKAFVKRAKNVFPAKLEVLLNEHLQKMEALVAKLDVVEETEISESAVLAIRRKIVAYFRNTPEQDPFSIRERRLMCYFAGDIVGGPVTYEKIATIINTGWGDRYLAPLMRVCLNKWNSVSDEIAPMHDLFLKKLKAYKGPQSRYNEWKEKLDYFKAGNTRVLNGAVNLGKNLRMGYESPLDFKSVIDFPKDMIHSEYFQKVIRTFYTADVGKGIPQSLDNVLEEHGNSDTSMIVLSDFIRGCEERSVKRDQLKLQSMALRRIGHPADKGKWTLFDKRDSELQKKVENARQIVNFWLIQEYINEIFQTLIVDPRRKEFWLQLTKTISDVKVIGPADGKRRLSRIESLKDSLDYCFKVTASQTSAYAFVMTIGSYKFIEFSEKGNALYIYRNDENVDQLLGANRIYSVNDLKKPYLPNMDTSYAYSCRMVHKSSNWEYPLLMWMKRYVR
ncbi:hypothetical protein FSU_0323 [Fibrobacter succinogenes subsp. succinogenes S85]|uniref:Zorya protein ZorC EH domain-containing protein n=1 Tax=Fibrobacter succinogenes (strain ATCC 19169 / S85) TaxID=59374 RepID=C9RPV5_FIBSS|nr:EH signature domain-containing protein [Fibrobacter succinogenes]ACX76637.1 hypothetical protein Fisuc_3057 [Fibrobacter succinogenes subsp. succinogenes S85]ADL26078.1 hypothetical protein FSU_0323 [Fibrobacter succinogenes subsp. succinogenes S85]